VKFIVNLLKYKDYHLVIMLLPKFFASNS